MNLKRISLLFDANQKREQVVLTAVCKAVKARQAERGHFLSLTAELNGVSIDEVVEQIPYSFGTVSHPRINRQYQIHEVITAIRYLNLDRGLICDIDSNFEVITLTDYLFRAIAEVWLNTHQMMREREQVAA